MQQNCVSLTAGTLCSNLNEAKNFKILHVVQMQMLTNSLWEFKCNLMGLLDLYIDIGTSYIPNMKPCSVCHWDKSKNKPEIVHCNRGFFIYLFIYIWF